MVLKCVFLPDEAIPGIFSHVCVEKTDSTFCERRTWVGKDVHQMQDVKRAVIAVFKLIE